MTAPGVARADQVGHAQPKSVVISVLGITQILAWGSSYYLPAVLAKPTAESTGWPLGWVVAGLSIALLVSGLIAPRVGRTIDRRGGRLVLAASAILLALGLAGLAAAPNIPIYLVAWIIIGLGMSHGLYDASFATLGRLYRDNARQAITALTLWGGFASTVCWPISAFLVEQLGWRGACLTYAAVHVFLVLPLYLFLLPIEQAAEGKKHGVDVEAPSASVKAKDRLVLLVLIGLTVTIAAVISSVISVHLLAILEARGVAFAAAVALGALIGPSQVGARLIEMFFGKHHHPIWTLVAAITAMAIGLGLLWGGFPFIALCLVFYGGGVGIKSIAQGTLPLALFGPTGYATLMGKLAMPSLIAQALSPTLGAVLMDQFSASATMLVLFAVAVVNVVLVLVLWLYARPTIAAQAAQ